MSDQNQDLIAALAALLDQRQDGQGDKGAPSAPAPEPDPEKPADFEDRLAACERIANQ